MTRRRKQQLAAGGAVLLAIVFVAVIAGGGNSGSIRSISVPAAQIPASTSDPHARDRAQISALAAAYQAAVLQEPARRTLCKYLDPQSRAFAVSQAKHTYLGPSPCWTAALTLSGDVAGGQPGGIDPSTVQFGSPSQQVRCDLQSPPVSLPRSQHDLPWAAATWAAAVSGNQVTFIKENGRWWIDVLLCNG
jgi:hypothetical protein